MKLVAGSYERFLFGFALKPPSSDSSVEGEPTKEVKGLPLLFNYPAHLGPIKSLAVSGNIAVTGGNDDIVKIYDLKNRSDMGSLMQHEGAVTCLEFHGPRGHPTHLVSGGEDCKLCVWDADTWQHLISLKGHKGAVNDLSVHPSGRLALSVARDSHLLMWSLVQGKCGHKMKLPGEAHLVSFAPGTGNHYALAVQGLSVGIHSSENGKEVHSLQHGGRVLTLLYHTDNVILTAGEESTIRAWDLRAAEPIVAIDSAHATRIRGLAGPPSSPSDPLPSFLASGSSDGIIRIWDPRMVTSNSGQGGTLPLMEADSRARLTCLALGGIWKGGKAGAMDEAQETDVQDMQNKGEEDTLEQRVAHNGAAVKDGQLQSSQRQGTRKKKKKRKRSGLDGAQDVSDEVGLEKGRVGKLGQNDAPGLEEVHQIGRQGKGKGPRQGKWLDALRAKMNSSESNKGVKKKKS